jgi:membrane protein
MIVLLHVPIRLRSAWALGGLSVRELSCRTWNKIFENEILTRAAAVAFYAMMAMVPFLGLTLTMTAWLLPEISGRSEAAEGIGHSTVGQFESTLKAVFPAEAYRVVKDQIARLQNEPPVGFISLGLVITIWLASSLFVAVNDAMNRIYGVQETRPYWKLHLIAIAMTVVQAVILIGSLLVIVAGPQILTWMGLSPLATRLAAIVQWLVVTVMVLLSFALTFYFGPDAEQRWEWITPGSFFGTIVFLIETCLFRIYVQNFSNYDRTYGSLGGVMILMFWFWMSSVIMLAAAQVNKVIEDASPLGKNYGQKIDSTEVPDLKALAPEPAST